MQLHLKKHGRGKSFATGMRRGSSITRVGFAVAVAVLAAASFAGSASSVLAGTAVNFSLNGALTTNTNYSNSTLPTNTTDVQVTTSTTALTDSGNTTLKMESFNLTDSSPKATYTITNKSTTNSILTLGNSAGFTNAYSGVSNDLLYLQDTNLTITGQASGYGTLTLALASTGNFDLVAGTYTTNPTLTISASITGAYGLTITGTGTTNLNATNTFSGPFAASGSSTVALGASGALGSVSAVNLSGSAVAYYSILSLSNVINSAATLSLSGTSAFQSEGSAQTLASLTGTSGTTMFIGDYVSTASPPVTTAGSFTVGNSTSTTYAGTIIGTHASSTSAILTKQGSGTLTLTGTNTYTGTTAINGGALQAASAQNGTTSGPLGASGTISFAGGTLQYSAANQFDYSSRFSTAAGQAYSVDTNGQAVTYATALTSSGGSLVKLGAGTLMLTGNSTYSGATTINGGTLLAAGATGAALGGTTQVNVNNGGTLQLGANNQINAAAPMALGSTAGSGGATFAAAGFSQGTTSTTGVGALTLNATATIDFGTGNTGNVLHFANSGATTWTSGSILYIANYAGSVMQQDGSTITGNGNALLFGSDATGLNSTQITQVEFLNPSGYTGTFGASIDNTGMVFADVPEPATLLGGVLLLGALGWNQRRRLFGLFGLPSDARAA